MTTGTILGNRLDELLKLEQNEDTFRKLQEQLETGLGVVPFVGAGFSIPCGMPGWRQFLLKLAEKPASLRASVEAHLQKEEFEEAADVLAERLGPTAFPAALEKSFGEQRISGVNLRGPVLCVPALTRGPVFTTNFDRVLERTFEQVGRPFEERVWGAKGDMTARALYSDRPYLIKLHGDVLESTERILTLADYKRHYGDTDVTQVDFTKPLPQMLEQVFTTRTLLFLGCSLGADRTVRLLQHVATRRPVPSRHFAVVELPGDEEEASKRARFLSERGIHPLWFPSSQYDAIEIFLEALRDRISPRPT